MFRITQACGKWLATTDDYGHALFIARHRAVCCDFAGTSVWCGEKLVYYTY